MKRELSTDWRYTTGEQTPNPQRPVVLITLDYSRCTVVREVASIKRDIFTDLPVFEATTYHITASSDQRMRNIIAHLVNSGDALLKFGIFNELMAIIK